MGEARGGYEPAFVALARIVRSRAGLRSSHPAVTTIAATVSHGELRELVRRRTRALGAGAVLVHDDDPLAALVGVLAGLRLRRSVRVVPARSGDAALRAAMACDAPGLVLHTAGTTGAARPAPARPGPRTAAQRLGIVGMLPPLIRPVVGTLAAVDHGHGLSAALLALLLGGRVVVGEESVRAQERLDVLTGVPWQLERFARDGPIPRIRLVLSGSDELRDPDALERALGAPVHEAYGTTETGTLTVASPDDRRRYPGTVGQPLPGVRIRASGGVLVVRAPALGRGTFSADRGRVEGGFVHVDGRADDVFVSAGLNIPVGAIRRWLARHAPNATLGWDDDVRFGKRLHVTTEDDPLALRERLRAEFGRAAPTVSAQVSAAPIWDPTTTNR